MAEHVLNNAHVTLNAVNLSDHVRSVTLNYLSELVDSSAMGDENRTRLGSVKDWSMNIEFNQDYAATEVNATLFNLVGDSLVVSVYADNGEGVSNTNPRFTGTGILESYQPLGGTFADMHVTPVTIQGNGVLSMATS